MKVLIVNNAVPFVWGGAEELAVNLSKRLNAVQLCRHQVVADRGCTTRWGTRRPPRHDSVPSSRRVCGAGSDAVLGSRLVVSGPVVGAT